MSKLSIISMQSGKKRITIMTICQQDFDINPWIYYHSFFRFPPVVCVCAWNENKSSAGYQFKTKKSTVTLMNGGEYLKSSKRGKWMRWLQEREG